MFFDSHRFFCAPAFLGASNDGPIAGSNVFESSRPLRIRQTASLILFYAIEAVPNPRNEHFGVCHRTVSGTHASDEGSGRWQPDLDELGRIVELDLAQRYVVSLGVHANGDGAVSTLVREHRVKCSVG